MKAVGIARDGMTAAALFAQVTALVFLWPRLPATLPMHFGLDGRPDGYGSRAELWLLVALSFFFAGLLEVLRRFPQSYNLAAPRGSEQQARQQSLTQNMIGWLRLELVLVFGYVLFEILHFALHPQGGFHLWGIAIAPVLIVLTVGAFLVRIRSSRD